MLVKFLKRLSVSLSLMCLLVAPLASTPVLHAQAGRDCDDNAVIRCGAGSVSELKQKYRENQAGNVQAVFREFGIPNEAALDGMVEGRVTSQNQVYVGDRLVATEALTTGRQNMPGSTPILGGAFYRRPPSVSFNSGSLRALVKMDGETFKFAVIVSCGNPVTGKDVPNPPPPPPPTPKPNFEITKDVRLKGQTQWQQHVTAKPGEQLEFRVVIKNTGDAPLNNMKVRDVLPQSVTFTENAVTSTVPVTGELFSSSLNIGTLAAGQSKELVFAATVAQDADACGETRLRNVAYAKPDDLPEENDDATANVCREQQAPPPPPPPAPAPVVLPNTGPTAAAGLFTISTLLGTALFRLKEFYLKRLS